MIRRFWQPAALVAAVLGLALVGGCTSDDNPTDPGGGNPNLEGVGTISGIVSGTGGFPISGADVTAGGVASTTNEEGYFVLSRVPEGANLVRFSAPGRVTTYRSVVVSEASSTHLPDVVLASSDLRTVDAAVGGSVSTFDGAGGIEIAAGSLVDQLGNPYTGSVSVRLMAMQPQDGDFYGAFPGGFRGVRGDLSEVAFESFGYLSVSLTGGGGDLRLAPGATALLRLAVAGAWASRAPASLPLWRFDETGGEWREEATATLSSNVYTAGVTHLSTWGWHLPIDAICGVTGFVVNDSGQPAAGVRVISRGVDHRYRDEIRTNADGLYTVGAVTNGVADLWAASGSLVGESLRVSVGDECPETAAENLVVTVPAYTIALTWGEEPADVDAHLLIPMTWDDAYDFYHIAYYSMGRLGDYPYAQLDTDDTSSFGPEIITGTRVFQGRFQYWVHDFSGGDTVALAASGATVQLEFGGALYLFEVDEVPLEGADESGWWHVFDLVIGGVAIDVQPVMRFAPRFSDDRVYSEDLKRGK